MKNSKINVSKTGKSAVSMAVQPIPDVVRCARGDISGRQLAKNTAVRVGGAYGAAGGMNAGAVIGTMRPAGHAGWRKSGLGGDQVDPRHLHRR